MRTPTIYGDDGDWEGYDETFDGEGDYRDLPEEAYYLGGDEDALHEEVSAELEHQYEDAFATYLDAWRHLAQIKASRGYRPVVALADT